MTKKVAVILAGCGVFDGSEVYEASLVQLRLDEADAEFQCMAPNVDQMHVLNHISGETMEETRNVLVESARLCRGKIIDVAQAKASDYDAVIDRADSVQRKIFAALRWMALTCRLMSQCWVFCRACVIRRNPSAWFASLLFSPPKSSMVGPKSP